MIRPALTSLLALSLALPALAAETAPPARRCDPKVDGFAKAENAADIAFPADREHADSDLHRLPEGALCEDAVWRVAAASWAQQASGQKKAQLLAGAAGVLETLDEDVAALEAAADKVYEASLKANLISAKKAGTATLKGRSFATVELTPVDNPVQVGGSGPDEIAAKLRVRADALAQLAVAAPPAPKPAKGKPAPPAGQATMGPVVTAYYAALEKVRVDAMKAQALGVPLKNLTPLFAPGTAQLADNYRATAQAIAEAAKWDDAAAHDSLLDKLFDASLRNRAARHTFNVETLYQRARSIAGSARDMLPVIDRQKKEALDKLNDDLRAKVLTGIDYEAAKQVFDGEVARNKGYASSAEGQLRAEQLEQAKAIADSARIAAKGKGYALEYTDAHGQTKTIEGKEDIPDLKTARSALEKLSGSVSEEILKGHDLMAKTHAALEAARAGATSYGENGLPPPKGSDCDGWFSKCEDLNAYKKRLRDEQMEAAARSSAARQPALETYLQRKRQIKEEYERDLSGGMDGDIARGKRDTKEAIARKEYESSTASSMNAEIAARTARLSLIDQAAESTFVERIEVAGSDQIPARMRPNLKKYVSAGTAKLLDGDGKGLLFDQFVADEWTPGKAALEANAQACKDSYREGDYGSLEKCAGSSLKSWLGKNVARTSPAVAARMRARLAEFVGEAPAHVLLEENGSDDGKTTMFDQFLGAQWTPGQGDFAKNAAACKGDGEYETVEKCASQSLKDWLAKRKRAKPAASTDARADVTTGDKR